MFINAPTKLVFQSSSSNGESNLSYPINVQERKSRSLASVSYPRNQLFIYPMYGYYAPQTVQTGVFGSPMRKSVLDDSDSSDDDVPLAKLKSNEAKKKCKKTRKKAKENKSERNRRSQGTPHGQGTKEDFIRQHQKDISVMPQKDESSVELMENNSEITLVDSSPITLEQGEMTKQDGSKKKGRYFSSLRTFLKSRRL